MPDVPATRTYVQLLAPSELIPAPEPAHAPRLSRVRPISAAGYRVLYRAVGGDWNWYERLAWGDAQLEAQLARPEVHVWVLGDPHDPDGYFELEQQADGAVEVVYFGLVARAMGRGLGAWMLTRAAQEGWALHPTRVWLHTCTLDSPRALPNYLARGFRPYRIEHYTAHLPGTDAPAGA